MEDEEEFARHSGRSQMSRKAVQGRELIPDAGNRIVSKTVGPRPHRPYGLCAIR